MCQPPTLMKHDVVLRDSLQRRLDNFEPITSDDTSLTPAAVVMAISAHSKLDEACIYITLRSSSLRKHAGQFALPGGKIDAGESIEQAALRELSEELGLSLEETCVMGKLDDFQTQSGFVISPIVVWNNITEALTINADEVARVFEIPFSELLSEQLANIDDTQTPPMFSINPSTIGHKVYSPTAALIYQFREVLLLGKSTRVAHYAQPAFAWR